MSTGARRIAMRRQDLTVTQPRSRPARASVLALAGLVLCLGPLGACSPATGPPSGAAGPRPGAVSPLAERHTWGGLCPEGPCRSTLSISDDGAWAWSDGSTDSRGVLSPREVDLLRGAITGGTLSALGGGAPTRDTALPEPARCEADADGRSVRYGWAQPGQGWLLVDSCEQAIDPEDPLVVHLEELADRLAP